MLLAALNEAKDDHAQSGQSIEDIARLAHQLPLDWNLLVTRARTWRSTVALWLALERARAMFDAPIPEHVRASLRPRRAPALEALFDVTQASPLDARLSSRRLRQAVVGPLLTDSVPRFAVSAAGFAAVRAIDAVVDMLSRGKASR